MPHTKPLKRHLKEKRNGGNNLTRKWRHHFGLLKESFN
jgi:hypothetical protein